MNNAITISAVDHWPENPFGGAGGWHAVDFAGVFTRFSQRHKQIHYSARNFLLVGPINESDFLSSQLSGGEQVGLLKSHRGFTQ